MKNNGKAIASLVLGILSLVCIWFGYSALLGIVLAIVGIVLGNIAKKEIALSGEEGLGMAKAGVICSIIGLALCALAFVACTACFGIIGGLAAMAS
jgi:hypothetical protein